MLTKKHQINFPPLSRILFIGLLVYWVIGLLGYYITSTSAQEPGTVSENLRLEEFACLAKDPTSFKNCISEANNTAVPTIKIIAPIICESRQDCSFDISNIHTSLYISPQKPENKFIRKNDFGYTLLNINNSSNIKLIGLGFTDEGPGGCIAGTICPTLVSLNGSSSITIENNSFESTKGTSLSISNSREITLSNSQFNNSYKDALKISAEGFTQAIKIQNNTFSNNSGTALTYQGSSAGNASVISSNKFINNHSGGAYSDCIYPCIGSQIKISGPTLNLKISENLISGGENTAFDSLGLYASGIEIGGQDIGNTLLYCNEITGNRGSGIVQSPPFNNITGISITENKIAGNGLNLNIPTATAAGDNCFTAQCHLSCMPSG